MTDRLAIALPWSLSHYIPLNGFHPLYRALFDSCPAHITLNAWDNIELSGTLRAEPATRQAFHHYVQGWERKLTELDPSPLAAAYRQAFFTPNLAATALLPGDLELHHTAAFPSMTRAFVLHCESFLPVFFPFARHGAGGMAQAQALRAHYGQIFASPLCLGIFSHIPHTLNELSRFFKSPVIDRKLFASRIGLSGKSLPPASASRPATAPEFLFTNSANQNSENFFHRGGHIVLRAWPAILARAPGAKLYLRCRRPEDARLAAHGVDLHFLAREQTHSVIWIEAFLTQAELNRLMARCEFFLLPSISLHSVSILQAMAAGAVPIVSDTIGTSRYLTHRQTGIVLQGVRAAHWATDAQTGILVDHYDRSPELDDRLVAQLQHHVLELLGSPGDYAALQGRAIAAAAECSGAAFASEFWQQLHALYTAAPSPAASNTSPFGGMDSLRHCLVPMADWPRIFESVPQPVTRLYTGIGTVTEFGGAFVHAKPAAGMRLHDWSALSEFCGQGGIALTFASSIAGLNGKYLTATPAPRGFAPHALVQSIARLLYPYPLLYRWAAKLLLALRRLRGKAGNTRAPERLDVQLLAQGIAGMNIIRCAGQYVAIPQDEGVFSAARLEAGGYRVSFKGSSMRQVMNQIAAFEAANGGGLTPAAELAEEGVDGLNIIRCAELFFAIPQGEGAFDQRRAMENGYSRVFVGQSLGEVKSSIFGTAS